MFLGFIRVSYACTEAFSVLQAAVNDPVESFSGPLKSSRSLHAALVLPMLEELYCIQIPAESRRNSPAVAVGTHRPVLRGIHGDRGKPEP